MAERPKIKYSELPNVAKKRQGLRSKLPPDPLSNKVRSTLSRPGTKHSTSKEFKESFNDSIGEGYKTTEDAHFNVKKPLGIRPIEANEGERSKQEIQSMQRTLKILNQRSFQKDIVNSMPDAFKASNVTNENLDDFSKGNLPPDIEKDKVIEVIKPSVEPAVEPSLPGLDSVDNKKTDRFYDKGVQNAFEDAEKARISREKTEAYNEREGLGGGRRNAPPQSPAPIPAPNFERVPAPAHSLQSDHNQGASEGIGRNIHIENATDGTRRRRSGAVSPGPERLGINENMPEGDKNVLRMVLTSRGPDAMNAVAKIFIKGKDRNREQQAGAMVHAEKMYSSENAYFTALKKFHKERKFSSLVLDNFTKREVNLPDDIKYLKHDWMRARSEYAGYMKDSALSRLNDGPSDPRKRERTMDRYQRLVVTKEILFGAEEAEKRAIKDGLETREKRGLEKLFDSYKKLSKPARVLISSALIGTVGAAAVAGGSILGTLGLVMAIPSAITATIALSKKNPDSKRRWGNAAGFMSLFTFGSLFGAVGEIGARGAHGVLGTRKKADRELGRTQGHGDLSDVNNVGRASGARHEALRASEKIDVDARRWRMGASLLGGIEAGSMVHGGGLAFPHFEGSHIHEHLSIGSHADGVPINDGEKLLGHFAKQLSDTHPVGTPPPAVQHFYDLFKNSGGHDFVSKAGENAAGLKTGFEGPDGSIAVQPHDQISLDQNNHIVIDRPGHPEMHHVLVDEQGVHPIPTDVWHHSPVGGHEAQPDSSPAHAPANQEQGPDTSHDHDGAGLNNAQRSGVENPSDQVNPSSSAQPPAAPVTPTPLSAAPASVTPPSTLPTPISDAIHTPASGQVSSITPPSEAIPAAQVDPSHSYYEGLYNEAMRKASAAPAGTQFPYDRVMPTGEIHHNAIVADGNGGGNAVFDISSPTQ
jgi:hypothetical protein